MKKSLSDQIGSKTLWLIASALLVTLFELLALSGYELPAPFALLFFTPIILAIGYQSLWSGLQALLSLNFKSIRLLMLAASSGAYYLGHYEEAAVVIVLYTLAEHLEEIGIAKSRSALDKLMGQMPKRVAIKGEREPQPVESVEVGQIMLIRPGELIALDGIVEEGFSAVDESSITGEPLPKEKARGERVFAGTLNKQGYLEVEVTKEKRDSTLEKIRQLTLHATRAKAETERFIETFAFYYTPSVILLSLALIAVPPLLFGLPFEVWLLEGLTLLVIACPCALVISTPISIYSAVGSASRQGILIKGGRYLEALASIKAFAFDKTRTLTVGKPHVTDLVPFSGYSKEELLSCAAGIELFSEHPLSESIVEAAKAEGISPHEVEGFESFPGKGVKANCLICQSGEHLLGKLKFILEEHEVSKEVLETVESLQKQGKTAVVISAQGEVEGVIALRDSLRRGSAALIRELKSRGIHTAMVTGDQEVPARLIAEELGMDELFAEQLPQEKVEAVRELLRRFGPTAMSETGSMTPLPSPGRASASRSPLWGAIRRSRLPRWSF